MANHELVLERREKLREKLDVCFSLLLKNFHGFAPSQRLWRHCQEEYKRYEEELNQMGLAIEKE